MLVVRQKNLSWNALSRLDKSYLFVAVASRGNQNRYDVYFANSELYKRKVISKQFFDDDTIIILETDVAQSPSNEYKWTFLGVLLAFEK